MSYAIIAAGGKGSRFQHPVPKQRLLLGGKPVLWWSLQRLAAIVDVVIVAYPFDEEESAYHKITEDMKNIVFVAGGTTRYESVRNGFFAIDKADGSDPVLIHDAARPLVSEELVRRLLEVTCAKGAAVPVLALAETVKQVQGDRIEQTVPRNNLFLAQTPQGFHYRILAEAYREAVTTEITDESMLVAAAGFPVYTIAGERENIKITEPVDLALAEFYLTAKHKDPAKNHS